MSVIESPRNEIELEVGNRKAEEGSALSRCHHEKRTLSLASGTDKTASLVLLSRLMVNTRRGCVNFPAGRFMAFYLWHARL